VFIAEPEAIMINRTASPRTGRPSEWTVTGRPSEWTR